MTASGAGLLAAAGAVAAAVVAAVLALAAPAGAHTSLEASDPANRATVASPPGELTLRFTAAVDPRTVSARVLAADGSTVADLRPMAGGAAPTDTVVFDLPELEAGAVYGVAWQSVGDDGHRASGEVVFGVGPVGSVEVAPASFDASEPVDDVVDGAASAARLGWYVALAAVAGAVVVGGWGASAGAGPATAVLARSAALVGSYGLAGASVAAAARAAVAVAVVARARPDVGAWPSRILEGYATRAGTSWSLAALVLVLLARWWAAGSPAHPPIDDGGSAGARPARAAATVAAGTGLAVGLGVLAGHGASGGDPVVAAVAGGAHLVAAAVWLGPLLVVSAVVASPAWRRLDPASRGAAMHQLLRSYGRVAGAALATLVLTGVHLGWVRFASAPAWNGYGQVLAVKVALVAVVVVPLGWHHHRRLGDRARPLGAAVTTGLLRSMRLEAGGLVVVLALAAALVGTDPLAGRSTAVEPASSVPATEVAGPLVPAEVTDVSQCQGLGVGGANCYHDYFIGLLERKGAEVAVARVQELYDAGDAHVRADCHQITHDIGRAAAELYTSLAEAFAFEASACWSGYYHGLVEHRLSGFSDDELRDTVGSLCQEAAEGGAYDFAHYNCVHGLGHGLMIRHGNDLFAALPYCQAIPDPWEATSCVGGAFMENIVAAQRGEPATVDPDDLLYPCNAVAEDLQDRCYEMQTSYVLWKLDYDFAAAFALCDRVPTARIGACYRSMGRDISGLSLLEVALVVERCSLGAAAHRGECFAAAAANAVFNDHATAAADALCDAVEPVHQEPCRRARDQAAATL